MIRNPLTQGVFLSALLILTAIQTLQAQQIPTTTDVPRSISYQGMLTDAGGTPMADGIYEVTVTLYADINGTQPIWTDTYRAHVIGGVFNLYLGDDGKPLPGPDAMNTRLWIGTSVSGAGEMRPLTPLTSSPYALTVPNESITTTKLAAGAVTAEKVSMNYVAGIRVNGQEIGGHGAVLNIRSGEEIDVRYDEMTESLVIGSSSGSDAAGSDGEKGPSVQDVTDGNNNWRGRDAGANQPAFGAAPLTYNTLAGGRSTSIATNSDYSTIAGGNTNVIGNGSDCGFVGGGCDNGIGTSAPGNVIGGGSLNSILDQTEYNTLGGGRSNTIDDASDYNVIGGGQSNVIASSAGPVNWSTIGGGRGNMILTTSDYGIIGGGQNNQVTKDWATIAGGSANLVTADMGVVAGGSGNRVLADASAITGGVDNTIASTALLSFIGGGNGNVLESNLTTIGGGFANNVGTNSDYSFIGGGQTHNIDAQVAAIGGGSSNAITANGFSSFIGGGSGNSIDAMYGTIGGGILNDVDGSHGTIPGGDRLWVRPSYAQIAVGFYNAPRGAVAVQPAAGALTNDPLFMVGNGDVAAVSRSNAFEVSYNGHSVVYDLNGSGAATAAIRGATYTDNIIYAWGDVDADGGVSCDFGVASVTPTGPGQYEVSLNLSDPVTGNAIGLNCIAITANARGDQCGLCVVNPVAVGPPTVFTVNTLNVSNGCAPEDMPFMFHVTGRP